MPVKASYDGETLIVAFSRTLASSEIKLFINDSNSAAMMTPPTHSAENIVAGVTFQFWAFFINFKQFWTIFGNLGYFWPFLDNFWTFQYYYARLPQQPIFHTVQ